MPTYHRRENKSQPQPLALVQKRSNQVPKEAVIFIWVKKSHKPLTVQREVRKEQCLRYQTQPA